MMFSKDEIITKCQEVTKSNPNNRCCKYAILYLQSEAANILSDEGEKNMVLQQLQNIFFIHLLSHSIRFTKIHEMYQDRP